MSFDLDLFVIGGGSGGVRAARVAAELGAKVALAEEYRMGGTCVIRGCVPKKLMVFASGHRQQIADAKAFGWDVTENGFEWSRFKPMLDAELDRLEGIYTRNVAKPGVVIHKARARLTDAHTVELATGERFTSRHILIATGGRPFVPAAVPGIEHAITSNEVFQLKTLPERLLVVGGGYIACELAQVMTGFGVKVTQVYRGGQILRGFDGTARAIIAENMQAAGVDLRLKTDVGHLEKVGDKVRAHLLHGVVEDFDQVLYATGRRPNTENLGLDAAGVQLGPMGEIAVNDYSQTNVPSIFAVGDVTDRIQLTPVAIREGQAFVETVFNNNPSIVDHADVPSAVFTQPEYGAVGLSEEAACEQETIEVYEAAFNPMQTAFIGRANKVLFKLVVSQASQKVLGCHIVAPGAGEMIQLAGVAIKMGATKADFDRVVAVHPTMAEEIVLLKRPTRVCERTSG
ncbi:MAG: glutathione-disulfide reductase [Deltaproteobacteria bacterium]